jgi:hypothetical protein
MNISSHVKIIGALLVGAVLVSGALLFKDNQNSLQTENQLAVVTEGPIRNYIPVADSVGDGMPDWQRSLVRTEALPSAFATSSDWEPTTLTDKFSVAFFENMLRNETYGPMSQDRDVLIEGAGEALALQAQKDRIFYENDINIVAEGDASALRQYGNAIADIILKHEYQGDSEMVILEKALRANDPNLLRGLQPLLIAYQTIVLDMQQVPVPSQMVFEHLDLLNSYNAIANDIAIMGQVFDDPMHALLRVKRYEDDVFGMTKSLLNIYNKLTGKYGVQFSETDRATQFLSTL